MSRYHRLSRAKLGYNIFRISGGREELSLYNTPADLHIFKEILLIFFTKCKMFINSETKKLLTDSVNYKIITHFNRGNENIFTIF